MRRKLVVNDPTLVRPTAMHTRATDQSVVRSRAPARSRRRVSRYWWGDSPKARRNSRLKWAGDRWAAGPGPPPTAPRRSGGRRGPWPGAGAGRAGAQRRPRHQFSAPRGRLTHRCDLVHSAGQAVRGGQSWEGTTPARGERCRPCSPSPWPSPRRSPSRPGRPRPRRRAATSPSATPTPPVRSSRTSRCRRWGACGPTRTTRPRCSGRSGSRPSPTSAAAAPTPAT